MIAININNVLKTWDPVSRSDCCNLPSILQDGEKWGVHLRAQSLSPISLQKSKGVHLLQQPRTKCSSPRGCSAHRIYSLFCNGCIYHSYRFLPQASSNLPHKSPILDSTAAIIIYNDDNKVFFNFKVCN